MSLAEYHRKRHFQTTAEPKGRRPSAQQRGQLSFVIQKHAATRLHYDFRLELDGVLKSWAVPKGPSLNPAEKRLAVAVEDHPIEYAKFEGTIAAGEYGAGEVIVWDRGHWIPAGDPHEGLRKGKLEFELQGEKLSGSWRLIQLRGRDGGKNWLLMKRNDEGASADGEEPTEFQPESVISGRTLEDIAEGVPIKGKRAKKSPTKKASRRITKQAVTVKPRARTKKKTARKTKSAGKSAGGKAGKKPSQRAPIEPQLARLTDEVPRGDEWVHEIKYDGYRLICTLGGGQAKLFTRNRLDWTHRFAGVAAAAAELPAESAVLDGEIVALSENDVSNFQALQNSLQGIESRPLVYYAFDLLELDGEDLRPLPLIERKQRLKKLLPKGSTGRLRYSDHLNGDGETFLMHCCQLGLEGIICKRGDRPYVAGRSDDWLKVKCLQEEELVIGGFTISEADKRTFGSLLLGYYDGKQFTYAGRVGTGFNAQLLASLRAQFDRLLIETCPFDPLPARERGNEVRWVRPQLVAQIQFTGWTEDHLLRHPSFLGLREDKTARSVGQPESLRLYLGGTPMPTRAPAKANSTKATNGKPRTRVTKKKKAAAGADAVAYPLTNPDRILYPQLGVTKLELATYYQQVADWMLPYLHDRPLSLLRCPEGQQKTCFFQKHAAGGTPDVLRRIEVEEKNGPETYLIADNLPGLLSLAQMGVLEIHCWGSRGDRIDYPDWFVIDLDPAPDVAWSEVVATSLLVRDLLERFDLQSFAKVTGGKGVHVVAPLSPRRADWDAVKSFTLSIAQTLSEVFPERYIAKMSKAARQGKIFIDYLRNDRGSTAIAPYSTRAKGGATVSVPLGWEELTPKIKPDQWTVENTPARLAKLKRDPWRDFFQLKQTLPKIKGSLRDALLKAVS